MPADDPAGFVRSHAQPSAQATRHAPSRPLDPQDQRSGALASGAMRTYTVRVSRRDGGWDAGIDGVGWIRVDRLTGAERAVRAHLAVLGFDDAATAPVRLEYGSELGPEIELVQEARAAADGWMRYAAERTRALTARLIDEGMSGAEVAMVLGLSPQRVSQLTAQTARSAKSTAAIDVRTTDERAAEAFAERPREVDAFEIP